MFRTGVQRCSSFSSQLFGIQNCLNRYQPAKYLALKSQKEIKSEIPKKPPNPYFLFRNEASPILREKFPDDKMIEIAKKTGELWRNLPPEKAQEYKERSKNMYQVYEKERQSFINNLSDTHILSLKQGDASQRLSKKIKKVLHDFPVVKRPVIPYLLHARATDIKGDFQTYLLKAKESWKKLSETEKQKYVAQYKDAMQKYQLETVKRTKDLLLAGHQFILKPREVLNMLQTLGKPSKSSVSPIVIFKKENNIVGSAKSKWNSLSEEKKQEFEQMAEDANVEIRQRQAEWQQKVKTDPELGKVVELATEFLYPEEKKVIKAVLKRTKSKKEQEMRN